VPPLSLLVDEQARGTKPIAITPSATAVFRRICMHASFVVAPRMRVNLARPVGALRALEWQSLRP